MKTLKQGILSRMRTIVVIQVHIIITIMCVCFTKIRTLTHSHEEPLNHMYEFKCLLQHSCSSCEMMITVLKRCFILHLSIHKIKERVSL